MREGRPASLLVIAPHPDDEAIAAFGLMMRLRRRGVIVRVLVVTDGAASHPNSRSWPRKRLVRERQRETRNALRGIGIAAGDVAFLGLPDGGLSGTCPAAGRGIAMALARAPKPVLVIAPVATDDHPDHRFTSAAVAGKRVPGARYLNYPVWPAGRGLKGARSFSLTAQQRLAKLRVVRSYRTQTGRITDDPAGFAMTKQQIAAFSRPCETFVEHHR